ncbi:MAG: PIG-L family deacetylase [Candidatus Scalindua sp.]|nr:PIG-L family deacetylase [Candidatus Scalindua sp.]MBT6231535.1 PIG-L family deacetylase [Candidatus Scalindua sp.]
MNKVLIIAPHPDDETLGCGGTIIKHKSDGDKIYWLIVTNMLEEEGFDKDRVKERQVEIDNVSKEYGFEEIFKLDFPTTKLDMIPKAEIIKAISNVVCKVNAELVYVPSKNDVHSDHKITFESVMSAVKTFRSPFVKKILMYETVSETEFAPPFQSDTFIPNSFSDISRFINRKCSIMKIYNTELGNHPFTRSIDNIRALSVFRGATAGVENAEAFAVIKEIW